jgi:hypothetical protein
VVILRLIKSTMPR